MPRIDSLYAFVAEDTGSGDEGIIGAKTAEGWMPLVGADMARVKSLRPLAEAIARETGKTIKLLHFETRREVEIIAK